VAIIMLQIDPPSYIINISPLILVHSFIYSVTLPYPEFTQTVSAN